MTRFALPLILSLATASAAALELPWDTSPPPEHPQYCKGFVTGGLDSKLVSGMSRTDLWLAWNYLIRDTASAPAVPDEYPRGRQAFQSAADNAAANGIVQDAYGSCGLGRSGHEVTGW